MARRRGLAALSVTGALGRIPLLVLPALVIAGIALPLLAVSRSPATRRIGESAE
jgi:hypothetical protein